MRSFEEKLTIKTSKSIFLKNVKKWEASTSWWNHFPLRWIYSSIRDCFVSQQLLFLFLLQSLQVFWKCDMLFANSLSPFLTMSSSFCKKSASFSWVFLFLMKQNKNFVNNRRPRVMVSIIPNSETTKTENASHPRLISKKAQ